jgi:nucleoside-diphosphate-sugar epimerase
VTTLVTGATGFVGTALVTRLLHERRPIRTATRGEFGGRVAGVQPCVVGDLTGTTDWRAALADIDSVVHLAGRAHVMRDTSTDPLGAFRRANVEGTLNLARQAAAAGTGRFVFVSSIKVNGESGLFRETDAPMPADAYGRSKYEAEVGLRRIADETNLQVVIIRPPLVYGPGVRANFHSLMRLVQRGFPLPLRSVRNRRSLIALANLVDFIVTCLDRPAAANETFLVSDDDDMSTPELIRRLARAMRRPARLIPFPPSVIMAGATILGNRDVAQRLLGSLQLNISKAKQLLGWRPPVSVDEELRATVAALRPRPEGP